MEGFSQARMEEREREGVEGVSDTGEAARSIDVIADDRMAESAHVYPNLMSSSGSERKFKVRGVTSYSGEGCVRSFGVLAFQVENGHFLTMNRMPSDVTFDGSALRVGGPPNDPMIQPFDAMTSELFAQVMMSLIVLSDDHQSAGIFVESVYDSRATDSSYSRESCTMSCETVDESAVFIPCPEMRYQSWRFIEDEYVGVFKDNIQVHWLRKGSRGFRGGNSEFDALSWFD